MAKAALASVKAVAADCFAAQAGFCPDEAKAGLLAADELRAFFLPLARGRATAPSAGVQPPAMLAVAARPSPPTLLQLPPEVLVLVLCRLDALSLALVAITCSGLYRDTRGGGAVRARRGARPREPGTSSRWSHIMGGAPCLAGAPARRAWAPVAVFTKSSFFVAEGGRLMSCGTEDDTDVRELFGVKATGVLSRGTLDADNPVVPTPTLLPSMAGIRISSVSAGLGFNVAVSAAGKVYTWGTGIEGSLGHGDEEGSLVPRHVQVLAGHPILSVAAGDGHSLAETERGEVFSWGWDGCGLCGHGSSGLDQLLPRRVEALTGARLRSASAGGVHSFVVTEGGALYSFGSGDVGTSRPRQRRRRAFPEDGRCAAPCAHRRRSRRYEVLISARRGWHGVLLGMEQQRGSVRPGALLRIHGLAPEGRGLEWAQGVRLGCWISRQQLRRDRSRRALHVGPRG